MESIISNTMVGRIALLKNKKHRDAERLFVAEGEKCVGDTLSYFDAKYIVATHGWAKRNRLIDSDILIANESQMKRMSSLSNASEVLAVYHKPEWKLNIQLIENDITLLLDGVQDPGNLGTIMRLADWFGVKQIVASRTSVDIFNAKAIQATMGSISRVRIFYEDLAEFVAQYSKVPVAGLLLEGNDIYNEELPRNAFIVMGNEGKGLTEEMRNILDYRLLIPSFPIGEPTGESLNVAMATAITLSEFRRRMIQ